VARKSRRQPFTSSTNCLKENRAVTRLPHLTLVKMLDEQKRGPGATGMGGEQNLFSTIDLEGKSEALNDGGSLK
jgi:hypothetical protein